MRLNGLIVHRALSKSLVSTKHTLNECFQLWVTELGKTPLSRYIHGKKGRQENNLLNSLVSFFWAMLIL